MGVLEGGLDMGLFGRCGEGRVVGVVFSGGDGGLGVGCLFWLLKLFLEDLVVVVGIFIYYVLY